MLLCPDDWKDSDTLTEDFSPKVMQVEAEEVEVKRLREEWAAETEDSEDDPYDGPGVYQE